MPLLHKSHVPATLKLTIKFIENVERLTGAAALKLVRGIIFINVIMSVIITSIQCHNYN